MPTSIALLLAAGRGSRLAPLTDHVPKPMLPIDGRAVIDTLIDQLLELGLEQYVLVHGHHGDVLRSHVERTWPGIDVSWVHQPEPHGSGDALQHTLRVLGAPEQALVAATDTAFRADDIAHLLARAEADPDALVTMGVRRWPLEQLPHRSSIAVDDRHRVRRVLEKPAAHELRGPAPTALSGSPLYVVRRAFWHYVKKLVPSPSGMVELAVALQQAIDDGGCIRAVEVRDTRDLTRPGDVLRHNFPYLAEYVPEL